MTRKKTCSSVNYQFNIDAVNPKTVVARSSSMVDTFYHEKVSNPDGSQTLFVNDPIYMLFNQQRLEQELGSTAVKMWLDSLVSSSDHLSELRSKCSDNELMYMIKSRHIQSPSELKSWLDYMSENVDKFNSELASIRESNEPVVEPPKTE